MFAQLSDAAGHAPSEAEHAPAWTMTRGTSGFGPFAQSVSSLRTGDADSAAARRFPEPPHVFLADWLAQRHGLTSRADQFVIAVDDPTRIWAARLMTFLESTTQTLRTRLDFVHADVSGGSLSLSCLPMTDPQGVQLHIYNADARERTGDVAHAVDAVHSGCDFLIQLIGPMEPQSFEVVAQRVRRLLQRPDQRLKLVLFVVSPAATRLRPALEALGQELGDLVAAVQGNLAHMDQVWNATIARLARCVDQHPALFPAPGEEPLLSDEPRDDMPLADEQHLLQAFASSGGVRWVTLTEPDGSIRALEADSPATAVRAVNAMFELLQADAADAPAQAFFAETAHTITIAQPLSNAPQWFAVQFDKAEIGEPLARLLASRMLAEIDTQDVRP